MDQECIQSNDIQEYLTQFREKVVRNRVPTSGSIELTRRCNLRCIHCYLGDQTDIWKQTDSELDTAQWINIIDQFTEAGCLKLVITGGEPLIRSDFPEIYTHAKKKGLLVSVFTNATLINEKMIRLFKDLPPLLIEVSLYGATAETYEKITGVKISYEKCIRGIQLLKEAGINFWLKSPIMTVNQHEYYMIEEIAKQYDVHFYFDASIFPKLDGDKQPIKLRISTDEALSLMFSNREKQINAIELFKKRSFRKIDGDALYSCGAGLTTFHIAAEGILQPCLRAFEPKYDLKMGRFYEGWRDVLSSIREKKVLNHSFPCLGCEKKIICRYCPPYFKLENGDEYIPSEYICALTNGSWEYLSRYEDKKNERTT